MINNFGTLVYTKVFGKFVGKDDFGNKYYITRDNKKKWVLYAKENDASNVTSAWHLWLTNDNVNIPIKNDKNLSWQKKHIPNRTGSEEAYKPKGVITKKIHAKNKETKLYNSWIPPK